MPPHRYGPAIAVPIVEDLVGILLDEWDTHIAECQAALLEAARAERDLDLAREALALIEAEILLAAEGRTRAERRARTVLALGWHDGWRGHRHAARAARQGIRDAECRATVARRRAGLVRAALIAALGSRDGSIPRLTEAGAAMTASSAGRRRT
jgi:hypothetical protein